MQDKIAKRARQKERRRLEKEAESPIKEIKVNWNDNAELLKLQHRIKCRLSELKMADSSYVSKKERGRRLMEACFKIKDADISHLYSKMQLSPNKEYYVYAHLDTSKKIAPGFHGISTFAATMGMDFMPFYIGKGIGSRCNDLNRNETHRKVRQKLTGMGKEPMIIKLFDGMTEVEALCMESKLIDIFGLIPFGGKLANLDEGLLPIERRKLYKAEHDSLNQLNRMLK